MRDTSTLPVWSPARGALRGSRTVIRGGLTVRLGVADQHGIHRQSQGRAFQVGPGQGRLAAGGSHVGDEGGEPLGTQRLVGKGNSEAAAQFVALGQAGQAAALSGVAGQEAGRALETGQHAGIHQPREPVADTLGQAQGAFLVPGGYHHQVAYVWGTQVGAQFAVEPLVGLGHRGEHAQLPVPDMVVVLADHHQGGHGQRQQGPAQCRCPGHQAAQAQPQGGDVTDMEVARQQVGQHVAGDQGGGQQAGDGVEPELGEAGEAGEEQGGEAAGRGQHPQADGGPEGFHPARVGPGAGLALFRLDEQVDGVIHRLADQGGAKAQGDAVHQAEAQAHRRHPGQGGGGHRQQAQHQGRHRAVDDQQQGGDDGGADQGQAGYFVLDGGPGRNREHAGAGHHQPGLPGGGTVRCDLVLGGGEGAAQGGDGLLLGVGVGAGGPGLHHQQGTPAVPGGPYPALVGGALAGVEVREQGDDLAGGVPGQQAFQQQPGGGGEQVDALGDGVVQAGGGETFRGDRRGQGVAVGEEQFPVPFQAHRFAVGHRRELLVLAQGGAQGPGQGGAGGHVGAFDAQQDHARDHAVLELVHQHLLFGGGRLGQKGGQVGGEMAARDHHQTGGDEDQPQGEGGQPGAEAGAAHDPGARSMDITERSPSAWRISMLRTSPRTPAMLMRDTRAAIFGSLGSR